MTSTEEAIFTAAVILAVFLVASYLGGRLGKAAARRHREKHRDD